MGTLFSLWQATTQAWQPVQRSTSTVMPQRYSGYLTRGYMVGWLACSGALPAQLRLARGPEAHPLRDLAIVLIELRLRDGEGPPAAGGGERDLDRQVRQTARDRIRRAGQQLHRVGARVEVPGLVHGAGGRVALVREGAGELVPLPHRHRHRARMDEVAGVGRQLDRPVRRRQLDQVAPLDTQLGRGLARDLDPRVPRHLGHGVRRLLQPREIGAAAVVEAAGRVDDQRVRAVALERGRAGLDAARLRTQRDRGRGRPTPHAAAPERRFPELTERGGAAVVAGHPLPLVLQVVAERGPPERALAFLEPERLPAGAEEDVAGGRARRRPCPRSAPDPWSAA